MAARDVYVRADYGMGQFKTEKLDALNANPTGPTYGLSFGANFNSVELGMFYKKSSFKSDIIHDSITNKIIHDGTSFGFELSFFLNNHFSFKGGYALNKYSQKLETAQSGLSLTAIRINYGLESDASSSNFFMGANYDIFAGKKYDIYVSALHFPTGDSKSSTTVQVGLRMYMDINFSSILGGR
jgi:hypothetical protein